jgi:hypothetical protein
MHRFVEAFMAGIFDAKEKEWMMCDFALLG